MRQLLIVFAFFCAYGIAGAPANKARGQATNYTTINSGTEGNEIFKTVTPVLLQKTSVPLRLPGFIPDNGDKEHPLYAILESADHSSYEIQLAWTKDCNGGNSCHYGTLRGSATPLLEENKTRVTASLLHGIKGYFIAFICGAHCDDSSVGWFEGGYYYSISLKAEKIGTMVKVANSAIATRQTKSP